MTGSTHETVVTTQEELDTALAAGACCIEIRSEAGVWLELADSKQSTVRAFDSATVSAYGSATVSASDSATVSASDSAMVSASDSATVSASDSATVRAYDSATVSAYGSATVRAFDSATVSAFGSATVSAYDSATVSAYDKVAIHLHSGQVRTEGGVVIDHLAVDETDPQTWCDYHGVTVVDGIATVYKAVNDDWTTERGTHYTPGSTPDCSDWIDNHYCGGGLHFGPTPGHAEAYHREATRYVAVGVAVADLRPILGGTAKAKAPRVVTPCVEVDVVGRPVAVAAVAS